MNRIGTPVYRFTTSAVLPTKTQPAFGNTTQCYPKAASVSLLLILKERCVLFPNNYVHSVDLAEAFQQRFVAIKVFSLRNLTYSLLAFTDHHC
jgi:hypothetical protein